MLIWLGHGDHSHVRVALRYVCQPFQWKWTTTDRRYGVGKSERALYHWDDTKVDVPAGNDNISTAEIEGPTMLALDHLFQNRYCLRGWIIQEVVLPAAVEMFLDKARIDLERIGIVQGVIKKAIQTMRRSSFVHFGIGTARTLWFGRSKMARIMTSGSQMSR